MHVLPNNSARISMVFLQSQTNLHFISITNLSSWVLIKGNLNIYLFFGYMHDFYKLNGNSFIKNEQPKSEIIMTMFFQCIWIFLMSTLIMNFVWHLSFKNENSIFQYLFCNLKKKQQQNLKVLQPKPRKYCRNFLEIFCFEILHSTKNSS